MFLIHEYPFYSLALVLVFLLVLWKLVFMGVRKSKRSSLYDIRSVVIVGGGKTGYDLYDFFVQNKQHEYRMIGFFDDQPEKVKDKHLYLGKTADCINYVIANKVDEIFCTLPNSKADEIKKLMLDADKNLIRFKFIPEYYDYAKKPAYIQNFGQLPVISIRPDPLESILNKFIKRLFDTIFSVLIIIFVFSWLFLILALIIKLQSKGPVFFVQIRSGRDNKPFKCYKFRSMKINTDSDKKQATRGDERITPIGAFMRRTSLDEFPQFFNVLIGNMSVVGPRPHMISHTQQYAQLIDSFMIRHFLKPGITGWAQVKGLRGEIKNTDDMIARVEADVWYLENWSFLLDLKIVFLTSINVLKGDQNAF